MLLPEIEVSAKIIFDIIITIKVIIALIIMDNSVSKILTTVSLYEVPQTRTPKCKQLFNVDTASKVFLCRAFFLFWQTCEW